MITDTQLKQLGFELLMSNYWRKDGYGVLRSWEKESYGALINFNSVMFTLEELKEDFKKKTGKELDDIDVAQ